MPVILAIQEAEIRRIAVRGQTRQIVHETPISKNSSQKRAGGMVQGVGPEFKHQYCKKKKKSLSFEFCWLFETLSHCMPRLAWKFLYATPAGLGSASQDLDYRHVSLCPAN
jgi:hypothetical protein